jgi:hypothetical protein
VPRLILGDTSRAVSEQVSSEVEGGLPGMTKSVLKLTQLQRCSTDRPALISGLANWPGGALQCEASERVPERQGEVERLPAGRHRANGSGAFGAI